MKMLRPDSCNEDPPVDPVDPVDIVLVTGELLIGQDVDRREKEEAVPAFLS